MHNLVSGINFQIHSVSLTSLVSIHLFICQPIFLIKPLSASITPSLFHQAENLPFQQIFPTLIDFLPTGLPSLIMGLDQTYHARQFIFS